VDHQFGIAKGEPAGMTGRTIQAQPFGALVINVRDKTDRQAGGFVP